MKKDKYGFERLIKKYESGKYRFNNDCDFYIEQLGTAMNATDVGLEMIKGEVQDWAEAIQEVSEIDDADTWLKKIQCYFMMRKCMKQYVKSLEEQEYLIDIKKRLEKILNRFLIFKSYN